ncbi:hypothetical protein [Xanthomonas arboricola]|uniref:hypothetical protein n=1 Tax=Xanthomonas arboricola TaxID=56448 RepID=UPI00209BBF57|nr:hypothetical protein [Xanthomonas arboricola]
MEAQKELTLYKYVVTAMLAAGSAFSSPADAAVGICNDCNLGNKQTMSREFGVGDHHLWDFNRRTVYHMIVSVNGGGNPPNPMSVPAADYVRRSSDPKMTVAAGGQLIVKEVALTALEQQGLAAGLAVYDANGGSPYVVTTLPASINITASAAAKNITARVGPQAESTRPMTAMDAVTTPVYRETATRAALGMDNLGPFWYLNEQLRVAVSNLTSVINIGAIRSPFVVTNIIQFPDGSNFKVEWNWGLKDYSYVKGSAKDAAGNFIPETKADVTGTDAERIYVYPNYQTSFDAGERMIEHISNLGVRWQGATTRPPNRSFHLACTSTPTGAMCTIVVM